MHAGKKGNGRMVKGESNAGELAEDAVEMVLHSLPEGSDVLVIVCTPGNGKPRAIGVRCSGTSSVALNLLDRATKRQTSGW